MADKNANEWWFRIIFFVIFIVNSIFQDKDIAHINSVVDATLKSFGHK